MNRLDTAVKEYFDSGNVEPMRHAVIGHTGEYAELVRGVLSGAKNADTRLLVAHVGRRYARFCELAAELERRQK